MAVLDFTGVDQTSLSVRESDIHGLGLFASRLIEEGELIGDIIGEKTTEDGDHVLWLDESQGFRVSNVLRYINHSESPNAAYYDDLTVMALRDIHPGEEITHDYSCGEESEMHWES